MPFTPEELAEMQLADEEIDLEFQEMTYEDLREQIRASNELDRMVRQEASSAKQLRQREQARRYYNRHRDEVRQRH